jgi:hypothetical protein
MRPHRVAMLGLAGALTLGCQDSNDPTGLDPAFAKGGKPVNYALDFTEDYVEVPDAPSLDFTTSFTLEAWIKPRNVGGSYQHIVSKWNGCGDASYSMEVSGGKVRSGIASCEFGTQVVSSNVNLVNDEWQHVAVTLGGGTVSLYVNGVLDNTLTGSLTPINSTRPLSIGREGPPFNGWYFDGVIDEVRVWNVARTAQQVAANMHGLKGKKTGLVGWWRFNEGTGTVTTDQSGTGNDGQVGGAVWTLDAAPVK